MKSSQIVPDADGNLPDNFCEETMDEFYRLLDNIKNPKKYKGFTFCTQEKIYVIWNLHNSSTFALLKSRWK